VFEAERPNLVPRASGFNGFHAAPASVSLTDADLRIVIRQDEHTVSATTKQTVVVYPRFWLVETVYDSRHNVPGVIRKPGILRDGVVSRRHNHRRAC
jgi:hypothetical protein